MKVVEKMAAQGDVLFRRVDALPKGITREEQKPGPIVVAHSETGHHHAIAHAPGIEVYRADPLTSYLKIGDDYQGLGLDVVHHRPYDTHETLRLLGGAGAVWQVRRQREHTPEGWRRVED